MSLAFDADSFVRGEAGDGYVVDVSTFRVYPESPVKGQALLTHHHPRDSTITAWLALWIFSPGVMDFSEIRLKVLEINKEKPIVLFV